MDRIGIITALADESTCLRENIGEYSGCSDGIYKVYRYKFLGKDIYLINSGVGEIAAALAAQYLISQFKVQALFNVGLVGSLNKQYKRGDLVAVKEIVHYDFTVRYSDDSVAGVYIGKDSSVFEADRRLIDALEVIADIPQVRIATADKFVDDSTLKSRLISKFGCDICDMESMGLYFACEKYNVPLLMIKCVSDNADENAEVSFSEAINGGVRQYVDYVAKLLEKI